MGRRFTLLCGAFAVTVGFAGVAAAQAPPVAAEGVVSYEPAFFAQFAPRNALDMVARVPGFSIDEGEDRRGFAGAQANVLINGEPPTSKAQEIDDVLARIPASDVVRIELIRGAGGTGAQATRVNVVRRVGGGEGVWTLEVEAAADGRLSPSGEMAFTGARGALEYGLSAALDIAHAPVEGARLDYDAAGTLDQRTVEHIPADEREARLAAEMSFPLWGGEAAANGQFSRVEFDEALIALSFDPLDAPGGAELGDLAEREDVAELGASYRRAFGPWRLDLGAVATRSRLDAEESTAEYDSANVLDIVTRQSVRLDSSETILRAAARRNLAQDWRIEFGAEAAFNTLEQALSLTEDIGAGPVPIVLPSANVRVEEERVEANFLLAGAPAPRWTLEAGAAVEVSRLTQTGDTQAQAELSYWKPSLQLARAFGARNQIRLRLYRDVGQLDFEDFVSAADIQNAVVNAGNPDLRPETSWRLEAAGDWRFGEEGAFGVTLYRWAIEDTLDIVPVGPPGNQFDAPGNIGDASLWGVRVQAAAPLPFDAQIRVDAIAQHTEVTDPLTGSRRAISESDESALTIALRQDLGAFAWGVDYEREVEAPSYRLDRIETERDAEDLTLWMETTAFGDVKLRAWAANLTDAAETRARTLFAPDRLGAFDGRDTRRRAEGLRFGVSASGRF